MNNKLIAYAREQIKLNLKLCRFKDKRAILAGCGIKLKRVSVLIKDEELDRAVDNIPCEKLSMVMQLLIRTLGDDLYVTRANIICIMTEIEDNSNAWECSVCGNTWLIVNDDSPEKNNMHYCTNCGARIVKYIGASRA